MADFLCICSALLSFNVALPTNILEFLKDLHFVHFDFQYMLIYPPFETTGIEMVKNSDIGYINPNDLLLNRYDAFFGSFLVNFICLMLLTGVFWIFHLIHTIIDCIIMGIFGAFWASKKFNKLNERYGANQG